MTAPAEGFELTGRPPSFRALARELWRSRELLAMLAKQDFHVRYRRASLGVVWAIGMPLVQAAVLAVVFTRVVRIETPVPYAVFVLAGVLPWTFFSMSLSSAATSIADGRELATKIYFPRAVLPLVVVAANLYGLAPGLAVLLAAMVAFGVGVGPELALLAPATVLLVLLTAGFALVLSALHVYFRDVRFVLQAALMAWFYGSPVIYPLAATDGALRAAIEANPLTGSLSLFRAGIGAADPGWGTALAWSVAWCVALLALAAVLHRRHDRVFVDLL